MPFDVTTETPAIRRARLGDALRSKLPEHFVWDFSTVREPRGCGSVGCAIGLATMIWPELRPQYEDNIGPDDPQWDWCDISDNKISDFFGMTLDQVTRTFFSPFDYGWRWEDVTPEMVANAIDQIRNNEQ